MGRFIFRNSWSAAIAMIIVLPVVPVILISGSATPALAVSIAFAAIMALWVVYFRLQVTMVKVLAFLLPFSMELPISGGSMLSIPAEPLMIIIVLVLAFELAGQPLNQLRNSLHGEFLWLLPLAFAFILSNVFSEMALVSAKFTIVNFLYILVFFVFLARLFILYPRLFFQMLLLYSMGLFVVLMWSIYRYWQWEWNPVVVRGIFKPFYNDHTIFGASSALLGCIWLGTLKNAKDFKTGIICLMTGMVFAACVFFSTSRAAILSLLAFSGVFALLAMNIRLKHLIIISLALFVLMVLNFREISSRLRQIDTISYEMDAGLYERIRSAGNISTDVSNIERLNRWVSAWRMFLDRPVTGYGPGTYQFKYIPFQDPSLMNRLTVTNIYDIPDGSGGTAHSEYFLALSEMGLPGLIGWLIILGRWTYIAFGKSRHHPNRRMIIAAFAALSTYYFHANFNNFLNTDKFAFLFWGIAAWLVANYHSASPREEEPEIVIQKAGE
jgi:putative inorganic carbon (hco3(-)) transporter